MRLYWLDLETTGLDPNADNILEVALAVSVLERPFEVTDVMSAVLRYPSATDSKDAPASLHPVVEEMHTKNGLLAECAQSMTTVSEIEDYLLTVVPETTDREDTPTLAGSSVHFDHAFLRVHMPRLAARFSHRHYDVSAVKLFCQSLGMPKPPRAEAHRAAPDVLESVEHARLCARWLRYENISIFTYGEDRAVHDAAVKGWT